MNDKELFDDFCKMLDLYLTEILEGKKKMKWEHLMFYNRNCEWPEMTSDCLFLALQDNEFVECSLDDMPVPPGYNEALAADGPYTMDGSLLDLWEGFDPGFVDYKMKDGFKKDDILNEKFMKCFRGVFDDILEAWMK